MPILPALLSLSAALVLATGAAAAPLPGAKNAASINAGLQAMRDNNLIALKDLDTSGKVEGRTFVGGDRDRGAAEVEAKSKADPKSVETRAEAEKMGELKARERAEKDGKDEPRDESKDQAATYAAELTEASAYLAGLKPTDELSYSKDGGQAVFAVGKGADIAVFSIGELAEAVAKQDQIRFALPDDYDLIVINVGGLKVTLPHDLKFDAPKNLGQKVVWNFYEAESVDLGKTDWFGSVLAPTAGLRSGGVFEGSVLARSLGLRGDARMETFASQIAINELHEAVPEPDAWALMIAGFGAIGVAMRRRRAALSASA